MRTLTAGGLFGMGPGAGTRKFGLPEPHTDYIFSVIGEEFGLIACLAIALLYLGIVARVLIKLLDEESSFAILAAAGLVIQFGLQALINMAVNVQIAPSKGMTLPFISYGGSSMLALSIAMGLLLAFTRRNPYLTRSPYVVKWGGENIARMNITLAAGGHRRAYGSGPRARRRAEGARPWRDAGHRRARGEDPGAVRGRADAYPARRAAGRRADRLDQGRARGAGRAAARPSALYREFTPDAVVGFGGYPAFPALLAANATRHPDHPARAECGAGPGQPAAGRRARRDRHRLCRGRPAEARAISARSSWSAIRCGSRSRGSAPCPFPSSTRPRRSRFWSPAAARARPCSARWCPTRSACCRPSCATGCRSCSNAAPDDIEAVRNRYAALNIPAELLTYIEDMPDRMAEAHLVIARAGASTIAELTAAGRPAILIPLPIATDDHQTANAREMAKAGGARMIPQTSSRRRCWRAQIEAIAGDPQALSNAAERALSVGRPHATSDLADLVERVAGGPGAAAGRPGRRRTPGRRWGWASRHEGDGHRDRDDPLRRHRRHRHVGHRRGDASSRLQGSGLATRTKAMSPRGCARSASR